MRVMSTREWISKIALIDRSLAGLLRGVLAIKVGDTLTFVWASNWHRDEGSRREPEIRKYLQDYSTRPIQHLSPDKIATISPMAGEAVALGGKIRKWETC